MECKFLRVQFRCCRWCCVCVCCCRCCCVLFYLSFVIRYSFVPVTNILISWLVKCSIRHRRNAKIQLNHNHKQNQTRTKPAARAEKLNMFCVCERWFSCCARPFILQHIHKHSPIHNALYLLMVLKLKLLHHKQQPNHIWIYSVYVWRVRARSRLTEWVTNAYAHCFPNNNITTNNNNSNNMNTEKMREKMMAKQRRSLETEMTVRCLISF